MHICGVNCSGVLLNYLWCVTQPADVCIAPGWRHTRAYKFSPCWTYLRRSLMAWERANVCRNSICCNVLSHEDKKEPPASHEKKKINKKTWGGNRVYARSLSVRVPTAVAAVQSERRSSAHCTHEYTDKSPPLRPSGFFFTPSYFQGTLQFM